MESDYLQRKLGNLLKLAPDLKFRLIIINYKSLSPPAKCLNDQSTIRWRVPINYLIIWDNQ